MSILLDDRTYFFKHDFLKDKYVFKPIENDQVHTIHRSIIDQPKIKYLRCQQLLYSTKLCVNKRLVIDNFDC